MLHKNDTQDLAIPLTEQEDKSQKSLLKKRKAISSVSYDNFFGSKKEKLIENIAEDENSLIISKSKKIHLQQIQQRFTPPVLKINSQNPFTLDVGIFLYSNDCEYIPTYFQDIHFAFEKSPVLEQKSFQLLDSLHSKSKKNNVGIVVGNGYILSLLPEIPADDIILLDNESLVHYFLLFIGNTILNANTDKDFSLLKEELIITIKKLEQIIYLHNSVDEKEIEKQVNKNLVNEMKYLGNRHFLSSKSRFLECKNALQKKELLPVKVDIFNKKDMKELGILLNKSACKVSFLNLTNVADYDEQQVLKLRLDNLPLSKNCKIITTSLLSYTIEPGRK
ncbi:MAG: hypothetical protein JO131_02565, partial [Gammaproteobacteria bacterium]|nr:hypothetical protein [Gammaproteobacteria bacterium]